MERGQRLALVGRSGAGKSTLLSLFYDRRQTDAAFVPQDPGLVKTLSVFHNVFMGRLDRNSTWYNLLNLARPLKREVAAILELLEPLGLREKIFEPAGELSGGQQQRTGVARALFQGAEVVLGDEPVSSVDLHQARSVLSVINGAYETSVLAMHDVDLALEFCDRIVGVEDGRVVLDEAASGMGRDDLMPLYKGEIEDR